MHRLQELVRLHRMGTTTREVARLLKMSPNTERKYRIILTSQQLLEGPPDQIPSLETLKQAILIENPLPETIPSQETSSIEEWREPIKNFFNKGLKARAIYDRLCMEEEKFQGSYWAVKRMIRQMQKKACVKPEEVSIPVSTAPGEIAQVDFGYVGKLMDAEQHILRRAWVFIMVLGYSRHIFAKIVFNQKTETFLRLHIEAFQYFGGVVETVVPDNLKAAVIRTAFGNDGDTELNRSYRELARYYGFKIDPTPPYSPKKKGKVESAVKYVKNNALSGREGEEINEVNQFLSRWVEEVAGTRIHGTTGEAPLTKFIEQEKSTLRPLPCKPYEIIIWKKTQVHQDTHIQFCQKLYSVPWRFVGQKVWVKADSSSVMVFSDDVRIATHPRNFKGKIKTQEFHLPEHRRDLRFRSLSYWENRAQRIGPETQGLVEEIFNSDEVLSQLRGVQSIVTHLEGYPKSRAENASRRARFYGTYSYRGIKRILQKALDFEPLPLLSESKVEINTPPRFARDLRRVLEWSAEVKDESH